MPSLSDRGRAETLPDEFSLLDDHLARKLGRAFGKKEGVRYGTDNLHIVRAGEQQRASLWAVHGDNARSE